MREVINGYVEDLEELEFRGGINTLDLFWTKCFEVQIRNDSRNRKSVFYMIKPRAFKKS